MAKNAFAQVRARSFGPFHDVDVRPSPGLNVIVGDNATGKSQLLKLMYCSARALKAAEGAPKRDLTKRELSTGIADKLVRTLRPSSLGRLTRRAQGRSTAEVTVKFAGIGEPLQFSFSSHARREVTVDRLPGAAPEDEPVYLPPHELFTLSSNFLSLYDNYETGFDETWRDTVDLLLRPALRGPRAHPAAELLEPFTELLQGGTVREEDGQLYLHQPGIGNLEAPLLAEGHRKLAMIVRLISNGMLLGGGHLFWDEPESNLNPMSQRAVARALVHLADGGAQVFVATHSMFLLREIQMMEHAKPPRYVGLTRSSGGAEATSAAQVVAQTTDDLDDLDYIAALRAETEQAERYLAW